MPILVAECVTIEEFERLRHERSQDQRTPTGQKNQQKNQQNPSGKRFFSTILGRYVMILLQFVVTVTVGAIFFKANPREGGDMTWVDSFYFAVVTSTAVGYGDITPQSVGGKIFSIPYMFFSTLIVGKLVAQFIKL
jgi:voltage-gated potassium channel